MSKSAQVGPWAVYQMTVRGQPGPNVVCFQHEWDAVEEGDPGLHRLIKGGISNEGEAEQLARGESGNPPVRLKKKRILVLPDVKPDFIVEYGEAGTVQGQNDAGSLPLPFPALATQTGELRAAEPPARVGAGPSDEVA
jgi:hypothetical protein